DRELIEECVLIHARETLGQMHVLTRALEGELVGEIPRLDHQSLALPMAAVAARPLTDGWRKMRASVERNHAGVMEHLGENHHVSGSLRDLVIVVVGAAKHGRAIVAHEDTTRAERLGLYGIVGTPALSRRGTLGGSPLALR